MKVRPSIVAATLVLIIGCTSSKSAPVDSNATASGAAVKILAAGRVDSLPTGGVFVGVIEFPQPALYLFPSKQHVAGFVYVDSGVHRLTLEGSPSVDIPAGSATFHGNVSHTHYNPGPGSSVWYFIAVWPTSARGQALVAPIAVPRFQSDDFSPTQLPPGVYSQVLRLVTLAPSGHSESHRFGGLSLFFVLGGSITIQSDHGAITLEADHGAVYAPNVAVQESNNGSGTAKYLEMLTTAPGTEFEAPLAHSPGG